MISLPEQDKFALAAPVMPCQGTNWLLVQILPDKSRTPKVQSAT